METEATFVEIAHPYERAADRLGCSTRTIARMVSRGELRALKIGPRMVRIPESEIQRVLAGTP